MSQLVHSQNLNSSFLSPAPKHQLTKELSYSENASTNASFELEKSEKKSFKLLQFAQSEKAETCSSYSEKKCAQSTQDEDLKSVV